MTFVILGGTFANRPDLKRNLQNVEIDVLQETGFGAFSVLTSRPLQRAAHGRAASFFDGYAFDGDGTLYHANLKRADGTPRTPPTEAIDDLDGVFCQLDITGDTSPAWTVRAGRVGQYPVFYLTDSDGCIVTDDLNLLREIALRAGRACDADPIQAAMHTVWGTGFVPKTPFRNLYILPARHRIVSKPAGGLEIVETVSRSSLLETYRDYGEAIGDLKARLTRRCAGIVEGTDSGWNRIVDVTGGLDSRMTMAGFLSTGKADRMGYFTLGPFTQRADRKVSDNLLGLHGLSFGRGVMHNSRQKYSPLATVAAGIHRYFGMKSWNFTDFGDLHLDDYCRVTGFFGEMTKAHGAPIIHGERPRPDPTGTVDQFLTRMPRKTAFLTADGYAAVRADLIDYYEALMAEVDIDLVNTFVYFEQKSKFHFGLHSSVANKFRISLDPLLDSRSAAAARHLSYRDLKDSRIAFDLIRDLGGAKLAYAPFAGSPWPERWPDPGHADAVAGMIQVRDGTEVDWPEIPGQRVFDLDTTAPPRVTDFERDIATLGGGENLGYHEKAILILSEAIPDNDAYWDVFDRTLVTPETLARAAPAKFQQNKRRLLSMMVCYLGLGDAPRQTSRVSVLDAVRPGTRRPPEVQTPCPS